MQRETKRSVWRSPVEPSVRERDIAGAVWGDGEGGEMGKVRTGGLVTQGPV